MQWTEIARGFELPIPDEQVERLSPVLEKLYSDSRRAIEGDLSEWEPVGAFKPTNQAR